jgi:hypothetical protein
MDQPERTPMTVLACRRHDRDHEAGHVAAPLNHREMPGAEADRYAPHTLSWAAALQRSRAATCSLSAKLSANQPAQ